MFQNYFENNVLLRVAWESTGKRKNPQAITQKEKKSYMGICYVRVSLHTIKKEATQKSQKSI
jgi:hypothetical protein